MRVLDASRVPPSCERCGKIDLLEANIDVWEFITDFPGVMIPAGLSGGLRVDYASVRELAIDAGFQDISGLIMKLEAVARGYAHGRK